MPLPMNLTLPSLPARPDDSHKGSFGSVLIVAGSRGMSGAAALAGLGALRGGAGLAVAGPPGIDFTGPLVKLGASAPTRLGNNPDPHA